MKKGNGTIRGKHTSRIDLANQVWNWAAAAGWSVSFGVIETGRHAQPPELKFYRRRSGFLLLSARSTVAIQEVRVFAPDLERAALHLAKTARNASVKIRF